MKDIDDVLLRAANIKLMAIRRDDPELFDAATDLIKTIQDMKRKDKMR